MNFNQKLSMIAGLFTFILFTALAFSSIFLQKQLRESQEIRKAAWNPNGHVTISQEILVPEIQYTVNNSQTLTVETDTNNTAIIAYQIYFTILSPEGMFTLDDLQILNTTNNGLRVINSNLTANSNNTEFTGSIIILTTTPESRFITNLDNNLFNINFFPHAAGQFQIRFDDPSYALTIDNNDMAKDELKKPIDNFTYHVVDQSEINYCPAPPINNVNASCDPVTGDLNVSLDWNDIEGVTSYYVQGARDENFSFTINLGNYNNDNPLTQSNVNFNVVDGEWYFRVRGEDSNANICLIDENSWSVPVHVNQQCDNQLQQCSIPNLRIQNGPTCNNDNQTFDIELAWDSLASDGITNYEIILYQITQNNGEQIKTQHGIYQDDHSPLSLSLSEGYWQATVKAIGANNCTLNNNVADIYFNAYCSSSCPAPSNFGLVNNDNSIRCTSDDQMNFTLNWTPVTGAQKYTILAVNSNDSNAIITRTTTSNEISYQNLSDGTWYFAVTVSEADQNVCQADTHNRHYFTFSYDCQTNQQCSYTYDQDWHNCTNGYEEQTYHATPANCPAPAWDAWHRPCLAQCQWNCPDWSACDHNVQSRTCSVTNQPCWDYQGNRPNEFEEVRYCEQSDPNFIFDTQDSCWDHDSTGESVYITWNTDVYKNVKWIDVSPHRDFRQFAHRNVENLSADNDWIRIDLTNFHWSHDERINFVMSPGVIYYARLYYSNDYHSNYVTLRVPFCSGRGSSYRIIYRTGDHGLNRTCNEWCADSNECADGYTCWYNYCRNPRNLEGPGADQCLEPAQTRYIYQTLTYTGLKPGSCNALCTNDNQCLYALACINNQCRHPSNPSSDICEPLSKGAQTEEEQTTANLTPTSHLSPPPTLEPMESHEPIATGVDEEKPIGEQTALDALKQYLEDRGINLKTVLIAGGISLLILILLFAFLSRDKEEPMPPRIQPNRPLEPGRPLQSSTPGSYTQHQGPSSSTMMQRMKDRGVQTPKS